MSIFDYTNALHDQLLAVDHDGEREYFVLKRYHAGELSLPSGRLLICDPFEYPEPDDNMLNQPVKPGRYPVHLYIAYNLQHGGRVAYAQVIFSYQAVVSWLPANHGDDDVGFISETGSAALTDVTVGYVLQEQLQTDSVLRQEHATNEELSQLVHQIMQRPNRWAANFTPPIVTDMNMIVFDAGNGADVYKSYWGYDAMGKIVCMLTDFNILPMEQVLLWEQMGFPSLPPSITPAFFQWIDTMQASLSHPRINRTPLPADVFNKLARNRAASLSPDLLIYYEHCTPWYNWSNPASPWKRIAKQVSSVVHRPSLPIDLRGDEHGIAVLHNQNTYSIGTLRRTPLSWLDEPLLEWHDYRCDLHTYLSMVILDAL